jgi:hypothetical protein
MEEQKGHPPRPLMVLQNISISKGQRTNIFTIFPKKNLDLQPW